MTIDGQCVACIWTHDYDDVLSAVINYIFVEIQRSLSWVIIDISPRAIFNIGIKTWHVCLGKQGDF